MLKKIVFTVSFILISFYGIAQKNINNYKYIILPTSFEFSKSEDQYQLNSLLKFLFNKYGYEAYFGNDDLPQDLIGNRCLALNAEALKGKGGIFKTKLEIELKDCFGNIVMTSQEGQSREKEYKKAYTEALREAFETFQNFDYKYVSDKETLVETSKPKVKNVKQQMVEVDTPKEVITAKETKVEEVLTADNLSDLHYAQEIDNGYQLLNSEPRIVMILLSTAAENVFMVNGKNAIVFKEDGFWYYSENNGKLEERKSMNIKF
ncbi:hypothetical protein DFQ10_109101 [Winogradskyella eximia]|uniref:Secreted protein n=1 Tax=Winogradskyella eximia TaxID=262006 RepID=A0A3D9GZ24_9FLAO|nr:hypothetical protein [Winogradskyella eximia]RED42206.1 hypothetical protein DFQ10_109101 [Winogradskyella eximia]